MGVRNPCGPATALQVARSDEGWKQSHVLLRLRQVAEAKGVPIAEPASLKTLLSRWENGHDQPDERYQGLLCVVYNRDPEELGFATEVSVARPQPASTIRPEMVAYFRNVFAEHVSADNLMGPHHLVGAVRAQLDLLDRVLPSSTGRIRSELLYLGTRYNEFTGWLYQDAGRLDEAMAFTDRAMDHALEICDPGESAYILMRKANIAVDAGRPDRAIGLTEAALRKPGEVPPRIRALLLGQRGRAYALLGDRCNAPKAIDQAREEIERIDTESMALTAYCTPSYLSMERARCLDQLNRYDQAIEIYEDALTGWPDGFRRDHGLCLTRLANAYAGQQAVASAVEAGHRAVEIVEIAPSGRAFQELQIFRLRLAPWRKTAAVSDLNARIRAMVQPAM